MLIYLSLGRARLEPLQRLRWVRTLFNHPAANEVVVEAKGYEDNQEKLDGFPVDPTRDGGSHRDIRIDTKLKTLPVLSPQLPQV